jgi:arylsulfatase A-like enzyme
MIRLPGKQHAGSACNADVGLIDLYPTLRTRCKPENPLQQLDGHDISPLLADPDATWGHPAVTTYGEGRFSLRSGRWRYIRYPDGKEELYDHRNDPHEFRNLAKEPGSKERKASFRTLIPQKWEPSLGGRKG